MNTFSHVPPGFRFHPTDEELVDYYLRKKIGSKKIDLDVIKDVDLYKIEPWDLQELCRIGSSIEEENEWYFFSHKDKKYPTGTRTNRATKAGFWKATGRDKAIYSRHTLIGMRKTLVFYKGRAPNGHKSDWIMHEYRLETNENGPPQEEGWVVCRVFKKRLTAAVRKPGDFYDHSHAACTSTSWYDHQVSGCNFMHEHNGSTTFHLPCKQELELQYASAAGGFSNSQHIMQLQDQPPFLIQLESPNMPAYSCPGSVPADHQAADHRQYYHHHQENGVDHQVTDWRVLDKFVASQLSHNDDHEDNINGAAAATSPTDHPSKAFPEQMKLVMKNSNQDQYGSTSTSSCHNNIDLWK